MAPDWPRWRLVRRLLSSMSAALASAAVLGLCAAGAVAVPGLGPALVPGHGAWLSAAGGLLPRSQTLSLPGLGRPASVSFRRDGFVTVRAASVPDAYLALGYLHARFRLEQMDLQRRLAEGRLAQLEGPSAVPSDRLELRLGLLRTAQQEWAGMPRSSQAARVLAAYARGVNDDLAQVRASGQWPALFSLAREYPGQWTPVDSLAVQGALTQALTFSTTPLDNALLMRSLGPAHFAAWFGAQPGTAPGADPQLAFDSGPYLPAGIAPLATTMSGIQAPAAAPRRNASPRAAVPRQYAQPAAAAAPVPSRGLAGAVATLLRRISDLRRGQLHGLPDSTAFAASGPKVAGGLSMLAAEPHLSQTIPSAWYEAALSAPGLDVAGVTVPGLPGVLIGHNAHIAWTLTDTQSQSALYYVEQVRRDRPGSYFWHGRWRRPRRINYTISVRGQSSEALAVYLTAHGPVLTTTGRTISVEWMGSVPSPDVAALLAIGSAGSFTEFRAALAGWRSPAETFLYADDGGNIGAISAGYVPVVRAGVPWLPMAGTGSDDVAGVVPYGAVPQVYNPPSHVIVTSNQRPVAGAYPYYLGTAGAFDPGYRASREYAFLRAHPAMSHADFAALQSDLVDQLAVQVLPRVLRYLESGRMTALQRRALRQLAGWNDTMSLTTSAGAAIWWTLWGQYLSAVFGPWWSDGRVPVRTDRQALSISASQLNLDQALEQWTLADPSNAAFTAPGGPGRTAGEVLRAAFAAAVRRLHARLGGNPASWAWGRLHSVAIGSLTLAAGLGAAPQPAPGDLWTVSATAGSSAATGPSLRMITGWSGRGRPVAAGSYPGGQSDNPVSLWYLNLAAGWRRGQYLALSPPGRPGGILAAWRLQP